MALDLQPDEYNKFHAALNFTLSWEGGYSYDPNDPGGETKWGISKRWHPSVDIKNMSAEQAADIYYNEYWTKTNCNNYPLPLCVCIFDSAVNPGPSASADFINKSGRDVNTYIALRKQYYVNLATAKPSMNVYLKGWLNRCGDLQKFCDAYNQAQEGDSPNLFQT